MDFTLGNGVVADVTARGRLAMLRRLGGWRYHSNGATGDDTAIGRLATSRHGVASDAAAMGRLAMLQQ